jgi:DNA polymerase elongation subunit (family B)
VTKPFVGTRAKILLLDIETSPNIVYSWGLFNQNISIQQVIEPTKVLSWAAKWYGHPDTMFASLKQRKPLQMIGKIHKLLDEADVVVHYNGKSFDIKHLQREFLEYGFAPPSPFKQVDLLTTARSQFKFLSNKLQYILGALELGEKADTGGFATWIGCLKGDAEAWEKMKKYNIQDVTEMEKLYVKLLPWIKGHPNVALYQADKQVCTNCGSEDFQKRGYHTANTYRYAKYCCNTCRKWFRGVKSDGGRQNHFTGAV